MSTVSAVPTAKETAYKTQRAQIQANCLPELSSAAEALESQDIVAKQAAMACKTNEAVGAFSAAPRPDIRPAS
eukprot:scaffold565528_cov17-Prasinocladus_malaysianus.AAC.1